MTASQKVLIVDDDASLAEALSGLLQHAGYRVVVASQISSALEAVRRDPTDLALLDLRLGQESGLQLLSQLKEIRPEMSVIMITGMGKIEDAVEAMKLGADNFVTKPIDPERLLAIVKKGFENRGLRYKTIQLERLNRPQIRKLLGSSSAITEMLELADAVAERDTTVLLRGETGSGKGLLASHIHQNSPRRSQAFVELNCAGLQRDLTESELFGHEKGAFTGAVERKIGLFEAADDGTLFLDEIGEMDLSVQAKLLKVLEQKRFRRIGGTTEIEVDVRIVAATHRDLGNDVAEGKFREDLFYRLNVFTIPIPPLRERKEDIIPLALNFLSEFRGNSEVQKLSQEAIDLLETYSWPGNVRELRNVIERAAILCPSNLEIQRHHLPAFGARPAATPIAYSTSLTMEDVEKNLLDTALKSHHYNLKATAVDLGISRGTLYRKIKKYNIPIEE
jgi:two-component system, NtrC family, response regulator AtoC